MKRMGFIFLSLSVLFMIASCLGGSYIITVGEIEASSDQMKGEYGQFSGHYYKKVKVGQDEYMEISFLVETEEGEIVAFIIDSNGNTVQTLTSGDTYTLKHSDTYKLQVEGKKHKGNLVLSWNPIQREK